MKKIQKTLMITGALAALMASPAYAMIKSIEINADTDSIPSYSAGTAFSRSTRYRMTTQTG